MHLSSNRAKYGIRRSIDGRVSLQSASGDWFSVRLDMEVPGAILLRREKDGAVFALETENLAQVGAHSPARSTAACNRQT